VKRLRVAGVSVVMLMAVAQALPIGQLRTNPTPTRELTWNSVQTRDLFFRSCGDCHSNETDWPWYSKVAPVSWLVTERVERARSHLNVSEYASPLHGEAALEATAKILNGSMPPAPYLRMNPGARLSDAERAALATGMELMQEFSDGS
jgi:mono/diheme cytochrome c family protein